MLVFPPILALCFYPFFAVVFFTIAVLIQHLAAILFNHVYLKSIIVVVFIVAFCMLVKKEDFQYCTVAI